MEKLNKKIIITLIGMAAVILLILLQKIYTKSTNTPSQLATTNANLAGEKAMNPGGLMMMINIT